MTVHLIKLCVGIEDVEHLIQVQQTRMAAASANGEPSVIRHITRNTPRRANQLLDGGSMYWVIRRVITVRQPIIGIESLEKEDGRPACAISLENTHIRTIPRRHRAFQGWRYLSNDDIPGDLNHNQLSVDTELPLEMSLELRELGLL